MDEFRVLEKSGDSWEVVAEYLSIGEAREALKDCLVGGPFYCREVPDGVERYVDNFDCKKLVDQLSDSRLLEVFWESVRAGTLFIVTVQPEESGR